LDLFKAVCAYLDDKFEWQIIWKVMIPYFTMFGMALYVFLSDREEVIVKTETPIEAIGEDEITFSSKPVVEVEETVVLSMTREQKVCAGIFIVLNIYFAIFELTQLAKKQFGYFSEAWNFFDPTSIVLSLVITVFELMKPGQMPYLKTAEALTVMLLLIRIFYWMRFFSKTGYLVALILDSIERIKYFMFLFIIILYTFGTPLYILQKDRFSREDVEELSPLVSEHFTWVPLDILNNMYLLSLGEFEMMDNYDGKYGGFVWTLFLLATFFVQITFLNVLIAIMGGSFEEFMEIRDQTCLHLKLTIYDDYQLVLNVDDAKASFLVFIEKTEDVDMDKLDQIVEVLGDKINSSKDALGFMTNTVLAETKALQAQLKQIGSDTATQNAILITKQNKKLETIKDDVEEMVDKIRGNSDETPINDDTYEQLLELTQGDHVTQKQIKQLNS